MRDVLTYLGIGLIIVLTALLGAPYVIDFDVHRARFAEEISRVTGAEARLDGPIAFRILPTPYFSAQNMSLSGPLGAIRVGKAVFELSLTALLQGRLNFTRAELSLADIALDGDQLRRPVAAVQFEKLAIHDAVLRISHAGTTLFTLDAVDFVGTIPSVDGPYDGRGSFTLHDEKIGYSIASDAFVGQSLPLKAILTASGDRARGHLDGALDLSAAPRFTGKLTAEGVAAAGPWEAEGGVVAGLEGVALDKATLRLGEGAQAARLTGNARYDASKGLFAVDLAAARLDGPWADWIAGAAARASAPKSPVSFHLALDSLDWRGAWSQVQVTRDFSAPARLRAESAGGARIEATAAPDAKNVWRGKLDFSAGDFPTFASASGAPPLPFHQLAGAGDFMLAKDTLTLNNGRFALDRAKFTGDFGWTPAKGDARAKFAARLSGSGLDPSAAPDFLAAVSGDNDLDLTLDAQTVGKGDGKFSLRLLRDKGGSRLEKLDAHNIAGADFAASGEWTGAPNSLKGAAQLRAREFGEFAALLARLIPGDAMGRLAARAAVLSPAALNAKAGDGGYAFDGQLAATKIAASLDARGAVSLDIAAPEAIALLAQFGAPPLLAPQKLGPARVTLSTMMPGATGKAGEPIVTGKADLGRIHGDFTGGWRGDAVVGDLSVAGDASTLLGGPSGSGQIKAHVEARDGRVLLRQIEGQRGDSRFTGDLALSSEGVDGALDVSRFSAPDFIALTLGAPAPVRTGTVWSKLSFSPVLVDPPHARLAIRAAEVAPFGVPAQFDLTLAPNALSVAKLEATVNGGTLRGGFDLRRQAGQATLSGEVSADKVGLESPAFAATITGKLKFAGSGANMAALVGALAGSGAGHVAEMKISGVAPDAPEQVLAAQAASEALFNAAQTAKDLGQALAGGDLPIADGEAPLRLSEGRIKTARDPAAFTYDLNDLTFSLVSTVAAKAGGRADLTWSGAWALPTRKLDATGFVTLAATRALEREQARITRQREEDRARQREIARQRAAERERQKEIEREKAAARAAAPALPAQSTSGDVVAKPAAPGAAPTGPE